jgi:hypothetical protein
MKVTVEGFGTEIVHNWTGRFFAVLGREKDGLVVRELCRKAWGKSPCQYRFGNLKVGYIVPDRRAFLPGSQPFLTTVRLIPWRGGRFRVVWSEGALVEVCPAHELGVLYIPARYVKLANTALRPEAGPSEMTRGVAA